jgi:hypothetical protein
MSAGLLNLPAELQARVKAELKPGEVVTWAGQPLPARYAAKAGWNWLFFVPWTAFAVFWIGAAAGFQLPTFTRPQDFFALWGLPFVAIGVAGLGSPLWLRRAAAKVVYVVTSQRAFSIEGWRTLTVRSYLPAQLGSLTRRERADGSGDLILALEPYTGNRGRTSMRERGFFGLAEVKLVARLLEDLAARQRPREPA